MATTNIISDTELLNIVKNNKLYEKFPALHAIQKTLYTPPKKTVSGGCSKCARNKLMKSGATTRNAINAVKKYIKNMDMDTRKEFKKAIGVSDLRFTMTDIDGRIKEFRY